MIRHHRSPRSEADTAPQLRPMNPPTREGAEPRRHHFVPTCWLEGFGESGTKAGTLERIRRPALNFNYFASLNTMMLLIDANPMPSSCWRSAPRPPLCINVGIQINVLWVAHALHPSVVAVSPDYDGAERGSDDSIEPVAHFRLRAVRRGNPPGRKTTVSHGWLRRGAERHDKPLPAMRRNHSRDGHIHAPPGVNSTYGLQQASSRGRSAQRNHLQCPNMDAPPRQSRWAIPYGRR